MRFTGLTTLVITTGLVIVSRPVWAAKEKTAASCNDLALQGLVDQFHGYEAAEKAEAPHTAILAEIIAYRAKTGLHISCRKAAYFLTAMRLEAHFRGRQDIKDAIDEFTPDVASVFLEYNFGKWLLKLKEDALAYKASLDNPPAQEAVAAKTMAKGVTIPRVSRDSEVLKPALDAVNKGGSKAEIKKAIDSLVAKIDKANLEHVRELAKGEMTYQALISLLVKYKNGKLNPREKFTPIEEVMAADDVKSKAQHRADKQTAGLILEDLKAGKLLPVLEKVAQEKGVDLSNGPFHLDTPSPTNIEEFMMAVPGGVVARLEAHRDYARSISWLALVPNESLDTIMRNIPLLNKTPLRDLARDSADELVRAVQVPMIARFLDENLTLADRLTALGRFSNSQIGLVKTFFRIEELDKVSAQVLAYARQEASKSPENAETLKRLEKVAAKAKKMKPLSLNYTPTLVASRVKNSVIKMILQYVGIAASAYFAPKGAVAAGNALVEKVKNIINGSPDDDDDDEKKTKSSSQLQWERDGLSVEEARAAEDLYQDWIRGMDQAINNPQAQAIIFENY